MQLCLCGCRCVSYKAYCLGVAVPCFWWSCGLQGPSALRVTALDPSRAMDPTGAANQTYGNLLLVVCTGTSALTRLLTVHAWPCSPESTWQHMEQTVLVQLLLHCYTQAPSNGCRMLSRATLCRVRYNASALCRQCLPVCPCLAVAASLHAAHSLCCGHMFVTNVTFSMG